MKEYQKPEITVTRFAVSSDILAVEPSDENTVPGATGTISLDPRNGIKFGDPGFGWGSD